MKWHFDARYFTACNCDWGCPCNFNARPTEGRCLGWGVWQIGSGNFGDVDLNGAAFALYYAFPGAIENGDGLACLYIDERASKAQHDALLTICSGRAGGGIFELFGQQLVREWLPTKTTAIRCEINDGVGHVRIGDYAAAESVLLSYPDGSVITPRVELPHGIEFKSGLMTNAQQWWWRDGELLANYSDKYGAYAQVKFTQEGCVA